MPPITECGSKRRAGRRLNRLPDGRRAESQCVNWGMADGYRDAVEGLPRKFLDVGPEWPTASYNHGYRLGYEDGVARTGAGGGREA